MNPLKRSLEDPTYEVPNKVARTTQTPLEELHNLAESSAESVRKSLRLGELLTEISQSSLRPLSLKDDLKIILKRIDPSQQDVVGKIRGILFEYKRDSFKAFCQIVLPSEIKVYVKALWDSRAVRVERMLPELWGRNVLKGALPPAEIKLCFSDQLASIDDKKLRIIFEHSDSQELSLIGSFEHSWERYPNLGDETIDLLLTHCPKFKMSRSKFPKRFMNHTLVVKGVKIPVHKKLLTQASGYFKDMWGGSFQEAGTATQTELKDWSLKSVLRGLSYVFLSDMTDGIEMDLEDYVNLMLFMDFSRMFDEKLLCEKFETDFCLFLINHKEELYQNDECCAVLSSIFQICEPILNRNAFGKELKLILNDLVEARIKISRDYNDKLKLMQLSCALTNDPRTFESLARCLLAEGLFSEALHYYLQLENHYEKDLPNDHTFNARNHLKKIYPQIAECWASLGVKEKAYHYFALTMKMEREIRFTSFSQLSVNNRVPFSLSYQGE